jgi:hypothetical protein
MITLTYVDEPPTLPHVLVEVALSEDDGPILVERRLQPSGAWVSLGETELVSGAASFQDFDFAANTVMEYRIVEANPSLLAGMVLDGSGDYASTPDHANLDIVGDIELHADAALDDWASGSIQTLISKSNPAATQNSYRFRVGATGIPELAWTEDGSTVKTAAADVPAPGVNGQRLALRAAMEVDNGAAGRTIRFWYASQFGETWVQLGGEVIQAGVTSIHSGSAGLVVGAGVDDGSVHPAAGVFFGAKVTLLGGFDERANPDFEAQPLSTTSFVDAAGRTWTLQGDAFITDGAAYIDGPEEITVELAVDCSGSQFAHTHDAEVASS